MSPRTPMQTAAAVGLIRVSTDEQADSGLGLAAQRHAIQEAADRLGLRLVQVVEEAGVSGGREVSKRTGLLEAVDAVPRGGVLLVAKRDRVARDMFVMSWVEKELQKRDARLVSAHGEGTAPDTDPVSALILKTVTDLHAEIERLQAQLRTLAALAAKRRRGEKLGGHVPLGFDVEQRTVMDRHGEQKQLKVLVPSRDGQAVVRLIRSLRAKGHSLRSIGSELEKLGHRAQNGGKWQAKVIRSVLMREEAGTS